MTELERYKAKLTRLLKHKAEEPNNTYHDWDEEILRCKISIADEVMEEKTSWIPVSERLPEENESYGFPADAEPYMKRLELAYMTDIVEYKIGYFDGFKWMDSRHRIIENVVAWKIHEPYKAE